MMDLLEALAKVIVECEYDEAFVDMLHRRKGQYKELPITPGKWYYGPCGSNRRHSMIRYSDGATGGDIGSVKDKNDAKAIAALPDLLKSCLQILDGIALVNLPEVYNTLVDALEKAGIGGFEKIEAGL